MARNWIGFFTFVRREVKRFVRVSVQTLVSPWMSAALFLFVFGKVLGTRVDSIAGVPYIEFVLPGVLMMNVLTSAFSHTSSSLYFQRFARHIEEILVAPLSYAEMITGYLTGSLLRSFVIGAGILVIGLFFGAATMHSWLLFALYIIAVSLVFALLGLIVGLWANGFEQLASLSTFVLTPLSFLGGMFNSLDMAPPALRALMLWNPFFYFIDGLRFSMTGVHEASLLVGACVILSLLVGLFIAVVMLFRSGWRLRG